MIESYFRTIFLYAVLLVVVRLMGKRQIGQMEPTEFVVTMMVANLATIPMEDKNMTISDGLIPIFTVLGAELLLAFLSLKSMLFRKLLCGKPVILIENGNIMQKNLKKNRITLDELTGHLREKDVLDIRSVQYAILETNGNLSVFPYPEARPATAKEAGVSTEKQSLPVTIVCDGQVIKHNLKVAGKDINWVAKQLVKNKLSLDRTYLLTVDGQDNTVLIPKDS